MNRVMDWSLWFRFRGFDVLESTYSVTGCGFSFPPVYVPILSTPCFATFLTSSFELGLSIFLSHSLVIFYFNSPAT